jgi:hypothetical protein
MSAHILSSAILLFAQLFVALMMFAIPNITRRDLLFGVPVPDGFRSTEPDVERSDRTGS